LDTDTLQEAITAYESCTDPLEKAQMGFQIARFIHFNSNDYTDALKYFIESLKIAEEIPDEREISVICNGLGCLYTELGDYKKSEATLLRAISIAEKLHDETLLTRPYINIGALYLNQHKHYEALDCYHKALHLAEKYEDVDLMGLSLIKIGTMYIDTIQYEKAILYLRRALKIIPIDDQRRISALVHLALSYQEMGDIALAIGYFKRSIPMLEKVNNLPTLAEIYFCLAGNYFDKGKSDIAIEYVQNAIKIVETNNIKNRETDLYLYRSLMEVYDVQGNIPQAEYYIQKLLEVENLKPIELYGIYSALYKFYCKHQRYELAIKYNDKLMKVTDVVHNEKLKKNMAIQTANFEYEREKIKAELLKQQYDELQKHQKIIEQKNDELIKLHEEKDNLMNTISHDLKNYLGASQQAMDIFALKGNTLADNKYLKIVATSTARSLNLVKEILYSTKVSASKDSLSLQTVDINQIIAGEEDTLLLRGNKKGINIIFEYAPEPLYVQLDSEKWHRVFENLTTNAIKFTPAEHEICISTKREYDFACISIKDSGIGITPENIPKLFTPFSGVGRKGTEGEESTGLGLSIVKKLVELHGGSIEVFSEVGKGTEFVVKLRIAL